jgi:hypothetical protein
LNWLLRKISDYWDPTHDAVEQFSRKLTEAAPSLRVSALSSVRDAVAKHVEVLPDRFLLDALFVTADDLYRTAVHASAWSEVHAQYLEASAATFFSLAGQRGYVVHHLVGNRYEQTPFGMKRPLEFYPSFLRSAGLVYICPQRLAVALMERDGQSSADYFGLFPFYIRETTYVAERLAQRCHSEKRSYTYLNADESAEQFSFDCSLQAAGSAGVVTVVRIEAPEQNSNCKLIYPRETS